VAPVHEIWSENRPPSLPAAVVSADPGEAVARVRSAPPLGVAVEWWPNAQPRPPAAVREAGLWIVHAAFAPPAARVPPIPPDVERPDFSAKSAFRMVRDRDGHHRPRAP